MNENLYEMLGRKQAELEGLNIEYNRLLAVLGQVVSGEIERGRVLVDLAARTWTVGAKEPEPGQAE